MYDALGRRATTRRPSTSTTRCTRWSTCCSSRPTRHRSSASSQQWRADRAPPTSGRRWSPISDAGVAADRGACSPTAAVLHRSPVDRRSRACRTVPATRRRRRTRRPARARSATTSAASTSPASTGPTIDDHRPGDATGPTARSPRAAPPTSTAPSPPRAAAFDDGPWAGLLPRARAKVLRAIADAIEARAERIAAFESFDTGLPITQARGLARRAAENFRYFADVMRRRCTRTRSGRATPRSATSCAGRRASPA